MKRGLLSLMLTASVSGLGAVGSASGQPAYDDTFVESVTGSIEKADAAYALGRFREAYVHYHWAAIRDHARAQEIVGLMLLLGEVLYGPEIKQDREGASFWLTEAGKRGREVARHLGQARPLARMTK